MKKKQDLFDFSFNLFKYSIFYRNFLFFIFGKCKINQVSIKKLHFFGILEKEIYLKLNRYSKVYQFQQELIHSFTKIFQVPTKINQKSIIPSKSSVCAITKDSSKI